MNNYNVDDNSQVLSIGTHRTEHNVTTNQIKIVAFDDRVAAAARAAAAAATETGESEKICTDRERKPI